MPGCLAKYSIPPQHTHSDHLICPKYLSVVLVQCTRKWHVLLHTHQHFVAAITGNRAMCCSSSTGTATSSTSLGFSKSKYHWASFSLLGHPSTSAISPFTQTWEWIFAVSQLPPPQGWNAVVISTQNHLCQVAKKNAVSTWIWRRSVGSNTVIIQSRIWSQTHPHLLFNGVLRPLNKWLGLLFYD